MKDFIFYDGSIHSADVPEREAVPADSDVILRRTQSFEEDEK